MDAMDWAQIVSAGGSAIAAGIAAVSAYLSSKQIRYQFNPHLVVAHDQFQVKMNGESFKHIWWEVPTEEASYVNGGSTDYRLKLLNLGSGSAHSIKIVSEYDFESVYADVHQKIEEYLPGLSIEQDHWGTKIVLGDKHLGGFRTRDEGYGTVDYIRPAVQDKVIETFILDPTLSYFCMLYGHFLMCEKLQKEIANSPIEIDVTFRISYTSAHGRKCEVERPARLTVRGGRWKEDMSDGLILISLSTLDL